MVYDVLQNIKRKKEKGVSTNSTRIRAKSCKEPILIYIYIWVCVPFLYILYIYIYTHPLFGKLISQATPRPVPEDSPLTALSTMGKFSKFLGGSTVSCSTGVESSLLGTTCTVVVEVVVAEGSWFILRPRLRSRAELA